MNLKFYQDFWGESFTSNKVVEMFLKTLLATTRSYDSFVDWVKVKRHVEKFKYEIAILNSLKHSKDLKNELYNILDKYPEVVKVIPLIIAVREMNLKVLDYYEQQPGRFICRYEEVDFSKPLDHQKKLNIVNFCSKAGILTLLSNVNDLFDYLTGVEVGLDSNARKNRSGLFMEKIVSKLLNELQSELGFKLYSQKLFSKVTEISTPKTFAKRRFDHFIVKDSLGINIEVNVYNVSGSKPQEIVDSYIERAMELKKLGMFFIWVTDGPAWAFMDNQLKKAFTEIDFILNLHFVNAGFLRYVLQRLLS